MVVRHRGLLMRLMQETFQKERQRFGLDPNVSQKLDPEQELESMIQFENED